MTLRASAPVFSSTLAALFLLAGCASTADDRFPSLAKRPVEDMNLTRIPDAVAPPPAPPADAALTSRIAALRAQVASGEAKFRSELGRAQARVSAASGAPAASDAWMEAQMAISAVEAARRASMEGLASLDQLQVTREKEGNRAGADTLMAAIASARAIVQGQTDILSGLKRRLRAI